MSTSMFFNYVIVIPATNVAVYGAYSHSAPLVAAGGIWLIIGFFLGVEHIGDR